MSDKQDLAVLAEYLSTLDACRLPAAVVSSAKACLLYGLAVGVATRHARPARLALSAAELQHESGHSTRLIDGARTSQGSAVFANAVLLSGRVQGDSHPCGHIGGVVIPSALAAAERAHASGMQMLSSLVAGYEAALRIGRDHAADLSTRGFRTTPCYGVFGSVAATGRMRGFDAARMQSALAAAANFAGGLREYVDAGTEESPFHAGFAARNGVYAADLVASGLVGADSALHGKAGFYTAYGMPGVDYGKRLVKDLGSDFEFTTVTYKQYPACQFLRGMIKGLAELRSRASRAPATAIVVRMHPYEAEFIGVRFKGPFTSPTQTVMSAPFCAALAWSTGDVSYDGLRTYDDAAVNETVPRVEIIADPQRARYEPYITVTLKNGKELVWAEEAGDSGYRIDWKAAVDMARQLGREVRVPDALTEQLIARVANLDEDPGVMPLIAAVCAATTSD
ncbi:MAG: MmgE/PrpD family protein [Rhodospirillaceae bacterium]